MNYITQNNRSQIKIILEMAANSVTHHTQKKKAIYTIDFGHVRVGFAMEILPQGLCRKMMIAKAPSFFQSLRGKAGGAPSTEEINQILELFEYKGKIGTVQTEDAGDFLIITEPV